MFLQKLIVGPYQTNCYLVQAKPRGAILVIDPGGNGEIVKALTALKGKVRYIVNTHGHADHICGDVALKKQCRASILIHPSDAPYLLNEEKNLSKSLGIPCQQVFADFPVNDDSQIRLDGLTFTVIHTPGHTPGSICLYQPQEKILFSGDTLFKNGIGKVETGASKKELKESLKKICALADEVTVYPGHGEETTIGDERRRLGL